MTNWNQIAEFYGYQSQSNQLTEECGELIQAISKFRRAKTEVEKAKAYSNYVEEIADVEIMLAQIKHLLGVSEQEVATIKLQKLQRTLRRIEEGVA